MNSYDDPYDEEEMSQPEHRKPRGEGRARATRLYV